MRVLAITFILALAACGPQYKTERILTPPDGIEGRTCAAQCETTEQICRSSAKDDVRQCLSDEREDRRDYEDCLQQRKTDPKGKKRACWSPPAKFCRPDFKECDRAFIGCYRRCGGEVRTRRVCVANCE